MSFGESTGLRLKDDASGQALGPFTTHIEDLLRRRKRGSTVARMMQRTSAHAVSAYDSISPTLNTAVTGVPWFGPAASAVVQLVQRAVVSSVAVLYVVET